VLTSHPTLLIGPSDWDADIMPREEFARRIDALWRAFPEAPCAIVYGSPAHHAELAYLTNLVPKLEAAVAILSRSGAQEIHLGGGPNMLGSAKPLTWIEDIKPLRGGQAIGRRARETRTSFPGVPLVIGGGYMPMAMHQGIEETLGEVAFDATAHLWTQMRRISFLELLAIYNTVLALASAVRGIVDAWEAGAGVTKAVLAGERAANDVGAQDVRTLFSLDCGRTLQPFTLPVEAHIDPMQVYVAVRRFNYWAEGFVIMSERPRAAADKAHEVLRRALAAIKPGARIAKVADLINSAIAPHRVHDVTKRAFVNHVGLALEEPPYTNASATFEPGEVYSIKVGVSVEVDDHAIVSSMVRIREDGTDVLWST
jgi:peptidase M24-like protein